MKYQRAYPVYLTLCTAMAFPMTAAFATSGVYRFQMAGLSPLQLVLAGTALGLSVFLLAVGLLVFGLSQHAVVALAFMTLSVARNASHPVFTAGTNRGIESDVRATVRPIIGQIDAIGQVADGPPMDALTTRRGLRAAMVAVGLLVTPTLALCGRALGQEETTSS